MTSLPPFHYNVRMRPTCLVSQSRLFFGLPDSIKTTIAHPGGAEPQRGWGRMGGENSAAFHRSGVSGDGHVLADLRDAKVSKWSIGLSSRLLNGGFLSHYSHRNISTRD